MSSPFKTICSPPDAPPDYPRARQLAADPLVPGGLTDAGALLSAKTMRGVDSNNNTTGSIFGGDNGGEKKHVSVGSGGNVVGGSGGQGAGAGAGAVTAAAAAAAVVRGKAQAEAESGDRGGEYKCHVHDAKQNHIQDHAASAAEVVTCKNDNDNDERIKARVVADIGGDTLKRRSTDQGRGGQRGCQGADREEEDGDKIGTGLKDGRRESLPSDNEPEARGEQLLLPALRNTAMEREGGACKEKEHEEGDRGGGERFAAEATESNSKGSTTIVLDWVSGCTNGSITTNFEVSQETLVKRHISHAVPSCCLDSTERIGRGCVPP